MTNSAQGNQQGPTNRPGYALGGFGEGFGTGFDIGGPEGRAMGTPATIGQYSDSDLTRVLESVLDNDPRTAEANIDVKVKNGVVQLSGTVRNATTKRAAGDDAWAVPSVQDVHNAIQIKPRGSQQSTGVEVEKRPAKGK